LTQFKGEFKVSHAGIDQAHRRHTVCMDVTKPDKTFGEKYCGRRNG